MKPFPVTLHTSLNRKVLQKGINIILLTLLRTKDHCLTVCLPINFLHVGQLCSNERTGSSPQRGISEIRKRKHITLKCLHQNHLISTNMHRATQLGFLFVKNEGSFLSTEEMIKRKQNFLPQLLKKFLFVSDEGNISKGRELQKLIFAHF